LFKILLKNLLDNAFKYNTNNWKIQIKLDKNQLIISNTSKNFKEDKLENLLKMFYKNNSQSGFGIWLVIVDKIARKLGYKLEISYEDGVFRVRVEF
jgi:signal transduction histidine kinase